MLFQSGVVVGAVDFTKPKLNKNLAWNNPSIRNFVNLIYIRGLRKQILVFELYFNLN